MAVKCLGLVLKPVANEDLNPSGILVSISPVNHIASQNTPIVIFALELLFKDVVSLFIFQFLY